MRIEMDFDFNDELSTTTGNSSAEPLSIKRLQEIMASFPSLVAHPKNMRLLTEDLFKADPPKFDEQPFKFRCYTDYRIPEYGPRWTGKWLWYEGGYFPPQDRFVEYEAYDLPWLEGLGMVRKEYKQERVFYLMNV